MESVIGDEALAKLSLLLVLVLLSAAIGVSAYTISSSSGACGFGSLGCNSTNQIMGNSDSCTFIHAPNTTSLVSRIDCDLTFRDPTNRYPSVSKVVVTDISNGTTLANISNPTSDYFAGEPGIFGYQFSINLPASADLSNGDAVTWNTSFADGSSVAYTIIAD